MFCPNYEEPRIRMRNVVDTRDYRQLVFTAKGLWAATKMLMETGLLKQFELAKTLLYGKM